MYMSIGFSNINLCGHLGTSPLSIADDQPKGAMDLAGNGQCRAHGLQNARISCREINVRSRAYPLTTGDLWCAWCTFLGGAYGICY